MKPMLMLKLGPLILIVNLFFTISVFAENKYEDRTKSIVKGELRKFIFSEHKKILPDPLVLDIDESVVEIGYNVDLSLIHI